MYPISMVLQANETREIDVSGSYIELRSLPGGLLAEVILMDRTGGQVGSMVQALETDTLAVPRPFEKVRISNGAAAQTIRFYYGDGRSGSNRFSGNVVVQNTGGAFAQSTVNVAAASVQLAAANAARRYLYVENKHATLSLYLNIAGGAATVAGGITLLPGDSFVLEGFASQSAINAIASGAGPIGAVVVEG